MKTILTVLLVACSVLAFAQSDAEKAALGLAQEGRTDDAIAAFRKIVTVEPKNTNAADALAQLYYAKGSYRESYDAAMKGLAAQLGNTNLSITRAKAAIRLDKSDEAIQLMDGLINIDGSSFYPFYVKGQALDAQGKLQQAIGMYTMAIKLDPQFPMAWYDRAGDFYRLGRDEQALPDVDAFLKMAPDHDGGLNLRGNIYARMNRPDAAIENFSAAIASNPKQFAAYANRGQAYEVLGADAKAEADYRSSIAIDGRYAVAHYYLAGLLSVKKDNDNALSEIQKALALQPGETDYHALAAKILLTLGRDLEGLIESEKVIAGDPRSTDGWLFKATALSNMKKYDSCLATLGKAMVQFPDNYLFYAMRSFVYKQQGNTAAAAADEAKAQALGTK